MESVLIEKQQNTETKIKIAMFACQRIFMKNFNVDCSLSCDNSNMFVYTNSLNSVL